MKVFLIILGILAGIIILITVLLHFSVKAYIEADKKRVDIIVKYFGFTVYRLKIPKEETPETVSDEPEKTEELKDESPKIYISEIQPTASTDAEEQEEIDKKIAESAQSDEIKEPSEDKDDKKPEQDGSEENDDVPDDQKEPKPSLLDMWNEYKKYIPAGKKAFRKLLKLIRFYHLNISLTFGDSDPYKAGLNFGRINAVFYSILGLLCTLFTVTVDHTEIKCDYEKKVFDFYLKTAVYVRPSAVVALAAYIGIYYLKIRKSMKKLDNIAKAKENINE